MNAVLAGGYSYIADAIELTVLLDVDRPFPAVKIVEDAVFYDD
jgi:hypothetical protein